MSSLVQANEAQTESSTPNSPIPQTPNKQNITPVTLELERLTINQPINPFNVAARVPESLDQLAVPLTLTLDSFRFGVSPFGLPPFHRPLQGNSLEIDNLFRREAPICEEMCSEKKLESTALPGKCRKGRQPGKPKSPLNIEVLEAGSGELSIKFNRHAALLADDKEETNLRKAKSASEPTTEDSASQSENLSFPGLAGSLPNFKKAVCHGCKQARLVFWFGDATVKRRGDKYSCTECLKTITGEEKFLTFFRIEAQWNQPAYNDIAEAKQLPPLKEYLAKFDGEKSDFQSVALNFLLEDKKLSIQAALTRMIACLNSCRNKIELETQLFAARFIHDLFDCLIRIGYIIKRPSYEKKIECLDLPEKTYLVPEVKRVASQVAALQSEGVKSADNDLLASGQPRFQQPGQAQWFSLDFDERHSLGKRDHWSRNRPCYLDTYENDLEAF